MLIPVLERLIPVLIQAAQFPDDFGSWEKDKQDDFRRVFRCAVRLRCVCLCVCVLAVGPCVSLHDAVHRRLPPC